MTSLRIKLLLVLVAVSLFGVGTVAVVANRVTEREFAVYTRAGGRARAWDTFRRPRRRQQRRQACASRSTARQCTCKRSGR